MGTGGRAGSVSDPQVRVGVPHVFEQCVVLLADEGLAMVACHVVPVHAVVVEVVQYRNAML